MTDCLFCRIVAKDVPAAVVYENDRLLAFRDISPQAPTHVLVIPKQHYANAAQMTVADPALAGELINAAAAVAEAEETDSYRLIFNTGEEAGQTVFHAHLHVIGGKKLGHMV